MSSRAAHGYFCRSPGARSAAVRREDGRVLRAFRPAPFERQHLPKQWIMWITASYPTPGSSSRRNWKAVPAETAAGMSPGSSPSSVTISRWVGDGSRHLPLARAGARLAGLHIHTHTFRCLGDGSRLAGVG